MGAVGCLRCRCAASWQLHCTCLRPASNSPVTNRRASASFLDMPRVHTRIRISTPHVGVLITFIGACAPPFRHRKRTATNQRLLAFRGRKPLRGTGVTTSGATPSSAPRQLHRLGSKPRQPQRDSRHGRVLAAAPTATSPTARRDTNRERPSSPPPRQQANVQNGP